MGVGCEAKKMGRKLERIYGENCKWYVRFCNFLLNAWRGHKNMRLKHQLYGLNAKKKTKKKRHFEGDGSSLSYRLLFRSTCKPFFQVPGSSSIAYFSFCLFFCTFFVGVAQFNGHFYVTAVQLECFYRFFYNCCGLPAPPGPKHSWLYAFEPVALLFCA